MKNIALDLVQNEKGNSLLFFLLCIPVVLSLAVLVVDVSRYQSLREEAQEYADQLTLQAANYLPNTSAIQSFLLRKQSKQEQFKLSNIDVSSQNIKLEVSASVDSFFDFFITAVTGKEQTFVVRQTATASIAPLDIVVIMPDGISMRPKIQTSWGNASDWPESDFFNFVSAPTNVDQTVVDENVWKNWWEDFSSYKIWATQSCYNPVFSSVKSFVISLIDSYSVLDNSRIAVLSVPGADPLLGYSTIASINNRGLVENTLTYWDQENYLSDELCAIISEKSERYQISLEKPSRCTEIVDSISEVYYPYGHVSDCVKESRLSSKEAIYYHSTRRLEANEENILASLSEALAQIATNPESKTLEARANLLAASNKQILLLIDKVNFDPSKLLDLWETGQKFDIRLTIVPFYTSDDFNQRLELEKMVEDLKNLNVNWLEVYNPSDVGDLVEKVLPEIMEKNHQVLLKQ